MNDVSLAFLSQHFPHCCLPCPGGKPGKGRLTVVRHSQCYEPKKTGPQAAAPKRRQWDSAGEQGTQIAKRPTSKVASKKP